MDVISAVTEDNSKVKASSMEASVTPELPYSATSDKLGKEGDLQGIVAQTEEHAAANSVPERRDSKKPSDSQDKLENQNIGTEAVNVDTAKKSVKEVFDANIYLVCICFFPLFVLHMSHPITCTQSSSRNKTCVLVFVLFLKRIGRHCMVMYDRHCK